MEKQMEQRILHDCLVYLKQRKAKVWSPNPETAPEHDDDLPRPSVDGMSDLIGVLPPNGRLLAIVVKRPGRKPSPSQQAFLKSVRQAGGVAVCAHSVVELAWAVEEGTAGRQVI